MLALLSAMLSVPAKTAPAAALVSKDDVFSSGDCKSWCPEKRHPRVGRVALTRSRGRPDQRARAG